MTSSACGRRRARRPSCSARRRPSLGSSGPGSRRSRPSPRRGGHWRRPLPRSNGGRRRSPLPPPRRRPCRRRSSGGSRRRSGDGPRWCSGAGWAAAAAGVAAATLGRAVEAPGWMLALAVGLAALGVGWLAWRGVTGAQRVAPAVDEGLRQRLEAVRARLGPWAHEAPARLRELEGRFREWQARQANLEERRGRETAARDDVRRRLEAVEASIEDLRRWVTSFTGGAGAVDQVTAWWDAVCSLRRRL